MSKKHIAGTGQHSHAVPQRDGRVVEILDGSHEGTAVYWSAARSVYVFVGYDAGTMNTADRVILLRGQDVEALTQPYGCDLDSPDGLALVGIDEADDLSWISPGAEVLWDSRIAELAASA